jgi:hypothetical protein
VVVEALLLLDEVVSRRHQPIGLPWQRPPEAAARAVLHLVARAPCRTTPAIKLSA